MFNKSVAEPQLKIGMVELVPDSFGDSAVAERTTSRVEDTADENFMVKIVVSLLPCNCRNTEKLKMP